jgi:ABC-type glycerol-3-phosphate transport system permease component
MRKKHKMEVHKVNRSRGGNIAMFIFLAIMAAFMAFPLVMIINNAFKPLDEYYKMPPDIFVRHPTLENFQTLGTEMSDSWVPFSRYIMNTVIIVVVGVVGHVILSSMAAYPLAKRKFPGSKILFNMVVLSLMFSPVVTSVPNYIIISKLGINNTYLAVILPALSSGLGLFIMKQFMEQIPDSLMESAQLDGASEYVIFWRIVMPNVKPAWLTLGLLQFQALWGTSGAGFLRSEELKPFNYALTQIVQGGVSRQGTAGAIGLITISVPIIIFLITQSNVIETMTTSGMKD